MCDLEQNDAGIAQLFGRQHQSQWPQDQRYQVQRWQEVCQPVRCRCLENKDRVDEQVLVSGMLNDFSKTVRQDGYQRGDEQDLSQYNEDYLLMSVMFLTECSSFSPSMVIRDTVKSFLQCQTRDTTIRKTPAIHW